jgi:hypothetical protein
VIEDATIVETVALAPTEEEGDYSQDLVRHRWAGMDLMVKLRATDAAGQTAESEAVAYACPRRSSCSPSPAWRRKRARCCCAIGKNTTPEGADNFTSVAGTGYDAFAVAPASRLTLGAERDQALGHGARRDDLAARRIFPGSGDLSWACAMRAAIIDAAHDREEAESAEDLLWDIALQASTARSPTPLPRWKPHAVRWKRRCAVARRRKKSSRLMDMYEQAIEDYLAAQMAEALRERPRQRRRPAAGRHAGRRAAAGR